MKKSMRICVIAMTALVVAWAGHPMVAMAEDVSDVVLQAEQRRIDAIAKATRTAIAVFANGGRGGGSGVVISPDGYALTNFHVAKPAGDYMQCSMSDGGLYDAVLVGIDPVGDVALIKLIGRDDFPHAQLADSDQVRAGDWCFAVGNPFLLATDFQPTVTYGMISGIHRYQEPSGTLLEYADCLQTDASINPGNSGGPLFNADGDLIGINGRCSFEKRGRVNVGVGYSISINQIKHFLGYLRSGRIVDHATLGATVSSDEDGRVIVTDILENSDVFRRGVRYGDEILSFGGRTVTTVNGFKNVLGIFPRGWRIPLSYRHNGERRDVYVRLMGVHAPGELVAKLEQQSPHAEEQPKPQRKPKIKLPKNPGDEEPKPEEQPAPKPKDPPSAPKAKPLPDHIKPLIEKRKGYANYYFNTLNRNRVWDAFLARGDFRPLVGAWKLTGQIENLGRVEIVLDDQEVTGRFPGEASRVQTDQDLAEQLAPQGSGGLLVALHLWQRMLRLGPQQFGDVYYLGTGPVLDREGLCDILVATHDVVESRFLFAPESGSLVGIEMFSDAGADPCEVYFDDYREVDGRQLPHRLLVFHDGGLFADIQLDAVSLAAPLEPSA